MDPKTLSGLDPKFRETYERVMGTPTQPASTPTPPQVPQAVDTALPTENNNFGAFTPPSDTPSSEPETIVLTSPAPTQTSTYDVTSSSPTEGIPFSVTPAPQPPTTEDVAPAVPAPGETAFASAPDPASFSTPPTPPSIINPLSASEETAGTALPPIDSLMSTEIPAPQAPPAAPPAENLMSQINPTPQPFSPVAPTQSMVTPAPAYTPENLGIHPTAAPLTAPPATAAAINPTGAQSPLLRILLIIGGIVFFALYTIFWIKVFKLPFIF